MKFSLSKCASLIASVTLAGSVMAVGSVTVPGSSAFAAPVLGGFPIREPSAPKAGGSVKSDKDGRIRQIVVDANGSGPYKSINAAVRDIADGGTVYVLHGRYDEAININKSVYIQGDRGPGRGVEIVAPKAKPCLSFNPKEATAHAMIADVRLISRSGNDQFACVDVSKGVFKLKNSEVYGSGETPSVKIKGGIAMLEKNRIVQGSTGISISQSHTLSESMIIDNKIANNKIGIDLNGRADVVLAGNEIFDNADTGILSFGSGGTTMIGNKIRNNKGPGVVLYKHAKESLLRYNRIIGNGKDGVSIPAGVKGMIEGNEIIGNGGQSIALISGERPKINNNVVADNGGDRSKKKRVFQFR